MPDYYTSEQVAEQLHLSMYTVSQLAKHGYFGTVAKPGRGWLFTVENIQAYLSGSTQPPKEPAQLTHRRRREVHKL